jgi:hypothetical protein
MERHQFLTFNKHNKFLLDERDLLKLTEEFALRRARQSAKIMKIKKGGETL